MPPERRNALAALCVVAPAPSLGAAAAFFAAPGPLGTALFGVAKVVLYLTPAVWLRWVDRRPFSASPPRRGGLAVGLGLGLLVGVAVLGAYALGIRAMLDPAPMRAVAAELGFDTRSGFLGVAAWVVLGNALLEEYAYRWFIYTRCATLMGTVPAALLAAAIFTAHHVIVLRAYFDWPFVALGSAGVFVGGLLWTWCYRRYASIWPGYLSHALVDCAILAIGWDLLFVRQIGG
jgi:CAAX protease family protein